MKTFNEMRQAIMMSTPVVGPTIEEGLQGADRKKISAAIKAGKTVTGKSNRDDYSNKGKEFKILKLYVTPIGIITTFKATVDWGEGPKPFDQSRIASYSIDEGVSEKYDAYYAMVDAKKMAKKKGGKPDDYIDDLMKKRGYKKSSYSGKGVWKWVKEGHVSKSKQKPYVSSYKGNWEVLDADGNVAKEFGKNKTAALKYLKRNYKKLAEETLEEGTMRAGIFDSDPRKRKDAARKLVFFLKAKRNLRIGPMDDKQGGSNKAIDAYIKELMKYVFDDEMIDDLYPTGKNERVKANDIVVKRLKKMGVKVK